MSDRTDYHCNYYRENRATTKRIRREVEPGPPPLSASTLRWLEARSRENLILYHAVELIETRDTGTRPRVRPNVYRRLLRDGLISKTKRGHDVDYILSPLVLTILSDLELSKMTAKDAPSGLFELSPGGQPVPHGGSRAISSQEVKNSE